MKVLNAEQTCQLEQRAADAGMAPGQLMENAGAAVVRFMRKKFELAQRHVVAVCGRGNNGGDGFVAARLLAEQGAMVVVVLADGLPSRPEAQKAFDTLEGTQVRVIDAAESPEVLVPMCTSADFILDAIFGTGFHGEVPAPLNPVFMAVRRASAATIIAIDIPSGVLCDTGTVEGFCIEANYTVSFSTLKNAHLLQPGKNYCGQVVVVPIGVDAALIAEQETSFEITDLSMLRAALPPREPESNKGSFGRLLCFCGSNGMAGAATLAAMAAVRCGVGLADIALPRSIYPIVAGAVVEPVYTLLDYFRNGEMNPSSRQNLKTAFSAANATLIGCGLGYSDEIARLVFELIAEAESPVILDADGINMVAQNINVLKAAKAPLILTPHPGEMARLVKKSPTEIQSHRMEYARDFAMEHKVVLVLKGAGTITAAPNGRVYLNTTGNPGMGKGGSGDVLAGMIASFAAQGIAPVMAAAGAAHLHGMAGDRCAAALSQVAMTPSDMIARLPELFLELER